ncbi:MAG: uroporphyrinogen-III synthase [Actinomycetota bacterium]
MSDRDRAGRPPGGNRLRVAVTRADADNAGLSERLLALDVDVVVVPLIDVVAPADGGRALAAALARLDSYRWVVLTSANGVRAVVEHRPPGPWPGGVEVAVVGPATADAARTAGLPVALVAGTPTAAALVEGFPSDGDGGGTVLAPLAELAGPTVTDGLAARGWTVDRVEAYRTAAPDPLVVDPPSIDPSDVDIVTFFSPSVVDRWVDRFGADGPAAVCIGPVTAERATARGLDPVVTAAPHAVSGVVEVVARLRDARTTSGTA